MISRVALAVVASTAVKVLSINVGLPRHIEWRGDMVTTAIFKSPVPGPIAVEATNLEGDRQADLTVHGGARKSVYAYPHEHYAFWHGELPGADLGFGAFGENLTTEGLLETDLYPGDILEIGTAAFAVTVPRMPCYKLQLRFDRLDMVKRFWRSRRCGFYLTITRVGAIATGDEIRVTRNPERRLSIAALFASKDQEE
jgi:MOSC domain-containing protein YiiM